MVEQPYLTKEQFVEYVGCIKKTCDKDDMLSEAIEKACNDDCRVIGLDGAECSAMVDLLSLAMGLEVGTCDGNEIEYFIYDLNFGKDYKEGCLTDMNGTPIDISTAEKLYDYIVSEVEE